MLEPWNMEGSAMVANKGNDQKANTTDNKRIERLQTVIIVVTYGGNFMVSQLHLAKSGFTMEGNKGIMSKQTCPLLSQMKKNP